MRIIATVTLIILCMGNAEGQRRKNSPSKAKPTIRYAASPFDLALENLPPNYIGHSVVAWYEVLKGMSPPKGEYETSEQYLKRINSVAGDEYYAFKIQPDGVFLIYDADARSLKIWIVPKTITERMLSSQTMDMDSYYFGGPSNSTYPIVESTDRVSYYTASNSFGVKARVTRIIRISYNIADTKHTKDLTSYLEVSPSDAPKLKAEIGVLLVGKLAICPLKPILQYSFVEHIPPTISEPREIYVEQRGVICNLKYWLIYNTRTGEIIRKHVF